MARAEMRLAPGRSPRRRCARRRCPRRSVRWPGTPRPNRHAAESGPGTGRSRYGARIGGRPGGRLQLHRRPADRCDGSGREDGDVSGRARCGGARPYGARAGPRQGRYDESDPLPVHRGELGGQPLGKRVVPTHDHVARTWHARRGLRECDHAVRHPRLKRRRSRAGARTSPRTTLDAVMNTTSGPPFGEASPPSSVKIADQASRHTAGHGTGP